MMPIGKLSGECVLNGACASFQSTQLNIKIAGNRVEVQYTQGVVSVAQISEAIDNLVSINNLMATTNDNHPYRGKQCHS